MSISRQNLTVVIVSFMSENVIHDCIQSIPEDIKIIIQKMIKEHLGWLVVWGGFFGGFLGLVLSPIGFNIL